MRSLLRLRAERWRTGRSERGYVLVTTLTAMLLCLIIITSLLSLTLATTKVEETGRVRERGVRAAEGALDAALNQLRNSPTMASGRDTDGDGNYDPCEPVVGIVEIDGVDVKIGCEDMGLTGSPEIPNDDSQVALRLVGDQYDQYNGVNRSDWRTYRNAFAGALGGNHNAGELTGTEGQLVHIGAAPLRAVGGVEVKREVAAVRTDAATGPAFDIFGTAVQGGGTLYGGASTRTNAEDPPPCGVSEPNDAWGVQATDVRSRSYFSPLAISLFCSDPSIAAMGAGGVPGPSAWIHRDVQIVRDVDGPTTWGTMDCDDPRVKNAAGVMYLEGSFDAEATKILNEWFTGDCPETTFYFLGDVWFDAHDPSKATSSDPIERAKAHSVVMNDRTSNWVFGDPLGWDPANERIPNSRLPGSACDSPLTGGTAPTGPETKGTNITLSSRTGLYHNAGRVLVCGPMQSDGVHKTAISQRAAQSVGARFVPTAISGDGAWTQQGGTSKAANLRQVDSATIRAELEGPPWWQPLTDWIAGVFGFGDVSCWRNGSCVSTQLQRSFTAGGFGLNTLTPDPNPRDPGPGSITTAWLELTGDSDHSNNNQAWTRFDVSLPAVGNSVVPGGIPARTCTVQFGPGANVPERMPDGFVTTSYDLMKSDGTCDTAITDRAQLRGADVKATFQMNPFPFQSDLLWWLCGKWDFWNCPKPQTRFSVSVDAMALRTEWSPSSLEPTTLPGPRPDCNTCVAFTAPGRGRDADGNSARAVTPTLDQSSSTLIYDVLRDDTLQDGFLAVENLNITARMNSINAHGAGAKAKFTLTTASGVVCTREVDFTAARANNRTQQWAVMTPGSAGTTCQRGTTPVTTLDVGDLVSFVDGSGVVRRRATLSVEVTAKTVDPNQSMTVEVDFVRLGATATGYPRPLAPFHVRSNPRVNADGTGWQDVNGFGGDASFTVFGSTSLPGNAVEVVWGPDGSPTGYGIFNGGPMGPTVCGLGIDEGCRPGLVAGALASWTSDAIEGKSWPVGRQVDPVATSGDTRPPERRVWLTACVVDNDRGTPALSDDWVFPRALANATVSDVDDNVLSYGATVRVDRWKQFFFDRDNLQVGACRRPDGEKP
jgi:hypothetical protein